MGGAALSFRRYTAAMMALLFLGNSYTFVNELNLVVEAALEEGSPAYADTQTVRLAQGGYTFADHVARVQTDPLWSDSLLNGHFQWGILQDQSQIPGFHGEDPMWDTDAAAGAQLDDWLEAQGAQTVLLLTWGRRDGDSQNPQLYPDFSTMQDELTDGYLAFRDMWSVPERPVWVAPAGLAFARVYAETTDPADPTSLFYRLYQTDGSHPSLSGTWLVSCVIYTTLTGENPEGLTPPPGVDPAEGDHLAAVAYATVTEGDGALIYPWQSDDPGDTGDTADSGDTAPDTAEDVDTGDTAVHQGPHDPEPQSCGCSTATPWSFVIGLFGLAALRRRPAGR